MPKDPAVASVHDGDRPAEEHGMYALPARRENHKAQQRVPSNQHQQRTAMVFSVRAGRASERTHQSIHVRPPTLPDNAGSKRTWCEERAQQWQHLKSATRWPAFLLAWLAILSPALDSSRVSAAVRRPHQSRADLRRARRGVFRDRAARNRFWCGSARALGDVAGPRPA